MAEMGPPVPAHSSQMERCKEELAIAARKSPSSSANPTAPGTSELECRARLAADSISRLAIACDPNDDRCGDVDVERPPPEPTPAEALPSPTPSESSDSKTPPKNEGGATRPGGRR